MKIVHRLGIILLAILLVSCGKENLGNYTNDKNLADWFQGKYKVISCVSEDSLDLNNDGIYNKNLIKELDFTNAFLMIKVKENEKIFHLLFPEAFVPDEAPTQEPTYLVQGDERTFEYNQFSNRLIVSPITATTDTLHGANPIEVRIGGNNLLQVIIDKNLRTTQGWQKVRLIIDYLRIR